MHCVRNLRGQIAKRKEDLGNLRGYKRKEGEMGAGKCVFCSTIVTVIWSQAEYLCMTPNWASRILVSKVCFIAFSKLFRIHILADTFLTKGLLTSCIMYVSKWS